MQSVGKRRRRANVKCSILSFAIRLSYAVLLGGQNTRSVSINLSYAQLLNTVAWYMAPQSDHCTERSTGAGLTHYFASNNAVALPYNTAQA